MDVGLLKRSSAASLNHTPSKTFKTSVQRLNDLGLYQQFIQFLLTRGQPAQSSQKNLRKRSSKNFPSKTDMFTIIPSNVFREQSKSTTI